MIQQPSLTSLINTYQKKDFTLWQILVALQKSNETLIDSFNQVVAGLNWKLEMEFTVATGTDKLPTWHRITLPRSLTTQLPVYASLTVVLLTLSFKPVLTGTFTGDIKFSRDAGTTWATLFKPTPLNMTCPTGNQTKSWSDLAVANLYDGDILRLDCSAAGGATGVEVILLGNLNVG